MAENVSKMEKKEVPPLKKHNIKMLDLAFSMDCTGSMSSYIVSARDNIIKIVEDIVASEKSDVRLALVEYRDHPPQDSTFVTRVNDFTGSPKTMKGWLSNCSAQGGGDTPEAVADALHDVLKLSWREEATKICVCISDAPPHGINAGGDGFPNGCPVGIDPIDVVNRMAEKGITLYMVGCEPSITPYKDFFLALAYITGGQYVPLTKAKLLSKVIVGGAQEEMSLEQFMDEVNEEAQADIAAGREIDEEELTRRVHSKMKLKGVQAKQLRRNNAELSSAAESPQAKKLAVFASLADIRENYEPSEAAPQMFGMAPCSRSRALPPGGGGHMFGMASAPIVDDTVEETYECADAEISYAQSSRMVQKCLKRNKIKK